MRKFEVKLTRVTGNECFWAFAAPEAHFLVQVLPGLSGRRIVSLLTYQFGEPHWRIALTVPDVLSVGNFQSCDQFTMCLEHGDAIYQGTGEVWVEDVEYRASSLRALSLSFKLVTTDGMFEGAFCCSNR
jgi:hypothetical protein